ncbi:MAG: UDP-3-O-acyl-N-acetylglucosamine deacetylase [Bacteroidaceae bacterium]|nr:UDP-3-O-acyl-N-acetylglucosamine deacetylase [Bacteroidaceae bacterium]
MKQKTLGGTFSLKSKGLHTGLDLTVTMGPAPVNHGYLICRTDLEGKPVLQCLAENVTETTRGTVLNVNGVKCSTIEHGMAALMAAGINNVWIEVNGPEFPILDGSAILYAQEIEKVGVVEQDADIEPLVITETVEVKDEKTGSWIKIEPSDRFEVNATIKFPGQVLGDSSASIQNMANFKDDLAAARTFVFVREIAPLLEMGLIKGGDLDNAVVIYEVEMPQEKLDALCDKVGTERRNATKLGYIQHRPLRWNNECARHKVLDIIGDMALVGRSIKGKITAYKPGHTINNIFARKLREL